jgi:hypothetical protein
MISQRFANSISKLPATRARGSTPPGVMNKSEAAYAASVLDPMILAGQLDAWYYESWTLRIGDDLRYTPDWMLIDASGFVSFEDFKGSKRAAGQKRQRVAIRAAATHYPHFRFYLVLQRPKREGGGYIHEHVPAFYVQSERAATREGGRSRR